MDRVQAASFIGFDQPLLGQVAIATVLVGSAAALSSAGIAVPVGNVGFAKGWDERTTAAPRISPGALPPLANAREKVSVPLRAIVPVRISVPDELVAYALPRAVSPQSLVLPVSPDPVQAQQLVLADAAPVQFAPVLAALPVQPVEVPVAALVLPPVPTGAAAPLSAEPVLDLAPFAVEAAPAAPLRLINPPELRGFDLGRMSGPPRSVTNGFAKSAAKPTAASKVEILGSKDKLVGDIVYHRVSVTVAGSDAKSVDVRIGADMKPSIKVGDLLGLVSDRMDPDSAARFAAASSAGEYVSLSTLRAAGFDVAYSAGSDSISISVVQ